MSYGLTICNNNNIVQIDDTYTTYELKILGLMNTYYGLISVANINEFALVQPLYSNMGMSHDPSGTNGPLYLYPEPINNYAGQNFDFKYLVIRPKTPTIQGNYGLIVYNASGQLVFDSSQPGATFSGMYMFPYEENVTYTGPSIVKQIVLPPVPAGMDRYFTISSHVYATFADINQKTIVNIYSSTFASTGATAFVFPLLVMDVYV